MSGALTFFENQDLIAELKSRGYRVAKADRIRQASVQASISTNSMLAMGKDIGWKHDVYRRLGSDLGIFLMNSGAVPVREEISDQECRRLFRATVTMVVDNPEFDWPFPDTMKL